jgi:hypothetical protein
MRKTPTEDVDLKGRHSMESDPVVGSLGHVPGLGPVEDSWNEDSLGRVE